VDTNFDPKEKPIKIISEEDETEISLDKQVEQQKVDDDFHTLPLEAYDPYMGIEIGDELLEKYRGKNGRVLGRSRWFYTDGTSEFRDCEILSFDKDENRYVIKWCANGIIKKASRFNMRVEGEDVSVLHYRIKAAITNRLIAERVIQCNLIIDSIETTAPCAPGKMKDNISFYIHTTPNFDRPYRNVVTYLSSNPTVRAQRPRCTFKVNTKGYTQEIQSMEKRGMNKKVIADLFKEMDVDYKRSFKVMEFEAQLPYKGKAILVIIARGILREVQGRHPGREIQAGLRKNHRGNQQARRDHHRGALQALPAAPERNEQETAPGRREEAGDAGEREHELQQVLQGDLL
jgi:hypothetical protein